MNEMSRRMEENWVVAIVDDKCHVYFSGKL